MNRKVENLGYGQKRATVWKNGILKTVTLKKNVANDVSIVIEHFVKNPNGFGTIKFDSYTCKFN